MIRFASLQFRTQAAVAFAALAIVAVVLGFTGSHLVHLYNTTVATCGAHGDCTSATATFLSTDRLLQDLGNVVIALPAIVGIFWGAPLVARELETGTQRLVWTQSVTRTRWVAVKLGLVGFASIAVAGLFSLMMTWWSSPLDLVNGNRFTSVFDQRGIVPMGYAAFAFALGVLAGVLIRRTLPAMATALGGFVFVRVAVTFWVRPHLETAVHATSVLRMSSGMGFNQTNNGPLSVTGGHAGAWVFSDRIVDSAGHAVGGNFLSQGACVQSRSSVACIGKLREVLVYQPASRYWAFQSYEMAIFLGLAVICGAFCFWWMRRRVS
jgi:hypothetical protein